MIGSKEEYRKKLRPHIEEIYDIHIKSLDIKRKALEDKVRELKVKIKEANERKESMVYNINRATAQDLTSFHYLFFNCEGRITDENKAT